MAVVRILRTRRFLQYPLDPGNIYTKPRIVKRFEETLRLSTFRPPQLFFLVKEVSENGEREKNERKKKCYLPKSRRLLEHEQETKQR